MMGDLSLQKCTVGMWPHGASYDRESRGVRTELGSYAHITVVKWVFMPIFWVFIINMPIFSWFSPFLGDIGHFWSPNFWRKLEMSNQLQSYINQACLRPLESSQSRVMLKKIQAKAMLMQWSFWEGDTVGSFLEAPDIRFACRFLCRVLEI